MSVLEQTSTVVPASVDPVAAGAAQAVGGPPGRHARLGERRRFTVTRVLLLFTLLTCGLGWAAKSGCRDGSNWQHEYQYTRACYTDVVALYSSEGLAQGDVPYYDHPVEYPVLIGGVMQVSSLLARGLTDAFPDDATQAARDRRRSARTPVERTQAANAVSYVEADARGRHFYDVTWLLVTVCALVVTVTTSRLAGRRPWDAALVALAPGLLLHVTTNWDLVAAALAGAGLLAWARRRPVLAGVLLGLATATKLYPLLFLVPLLPLCWRAGRLRAWVALTAGLVGTAVAVTLPVYLTSPAYAPDSRGGFVQVAGSPLTRFPQEGLAALSPHTAGGGLNAVYRFVDLNSTRSADWDSLYLQVQRWRPGTLSDVPALNRAVLVLLSVSLLGLLALILAAPRRPRVGQVLFLAMTAFLLTNKVDSPQYVLWLLPLAVLARPRWRPFLAWQAAEVLVLLSRFYFFIQGANATQGIDIGWFFAAVLLRDGLLVAYAVLVVRDVLRPAGDVVRADGVDDPAGGVLDGAPDRRGRTAAARSPADPGPSVGLSRSTHPA